MFKFEWNDSKAESNLKKHLISFDEAKTVFYDDFARTFDDIKHSIIEDREIIFGYSNKNNLLIVSFTQRNDIIRIISARKVTKNERKLYEEYYR
jgi:uncharacterized DUF497 family protein